MFKQQTETDIGTTDSLNNVDTAQSAETKPLEGEGSQPRDSQGGGPLGLVVKLCTDLGRDILFWQS